MPETQEATLTTLGEDKMISIYRFNDKVAIHFPGKRVVYINRDEADKLSLALDTCVTDITRREFSKSTLSTILIGDKNEHNYK